MIIRPHELCSTALGGRVAIDAAAQLPLDALFLGAPGRPGWDELKRMGPIRFGIGNTGTPGEPETTASGPPFHRDFGDSCVDCTSDAAAVTRILPRHRQGDPLHIPTAMGFAFAQQWARLGHACVHGALLQVGGQGVLVLGRRAAGKSVLAASALVSGGAIVSDDYLLAGLQADGIVGERIRRFVSLRRSWAARELLAASPDAWAPGHRQQRAFLSIAKGDARFPEHSTIDRIWILRRPRAARRETSSLEPVAQAKVYAALVAAIQPLLLGADFPVERQRLGALVARLAVLPAARIETGQDIVLAPARAWARLLAAA